MASKAVSRDVRPEIDRASRFGQESRSLVERDELQPFWSRDGLGFIYRVDVSRDQHRFYSVDLTNGKKADAFDHEAMAKSLGQASKRNVTAAKLPIADLETVGNPAGVRFRAFGKGWRFDAAKQAVIEENMPPIEARLISPGDAMRSRLNHGGESSLTIENKTADTIELFWLPGGQKRTSYGKIKPGSAATQSTFAGHVWLIADASGDLLAGVVATEATSIARITAKVGPARRPGGDRSPDGKWRARIVDHNVAIEPVSGGDAIPLSTDGNRGHAYTGPFQWSPDSRKLAARRAKEVEYRKVHIVESSPKDQLQPKLRTLNYPKPGDAFEQPMPVLFDIESRRPIAINDSLFNNPWNIRDSEWAPDSSEFTFVYNQRGHQVMRIVGIRADSGSARTIHEERSSTFIDYSQKYYHHRLPAGREIIWASERDGFNHLYRIDETSGRILNPITRGNWNVLEVVEMDEKTGSLLLKINGMPGSDPYHEHFARVNVDGSGFTRLTDGDGTHRIEFSPDRKWILATWSRVDQPPVTELRHAADGKLLTELERADDSALQGKGASRPERFVAKGRDGKTDIHGIIIRPTNFDPKKQYPVVEDIYAGPHDYFVPKRYSTWSGANTLAELGFIIVKIDGMGTNWRGKAFHDVAWKNLKDSGFPDRIAWIKAAAATRPWMDVSRVGIYGGSAGGQSTLSGLLHHGDFYKVGVADCGCHDNRMDKIWWNEAWMGWPVDESYEQNSNVFHAGKLSGELMLIVGELDDNVDPASTSQVVAALQKANKIFDFVPIMNAGHGAAETPYGSYRRADFLVRHLQSSSSAP
jgi:dipeptidyl-peptidase 4